MNDNNTVLESWTINFFNNQINAIEVESFFIFLFFFNAIQFGLLSVMIVSGINRINPRVKEESAQVVDWDSMNSVIGVTVFFLIAALVCLGVVGLI